MSSETDAADVTTTTPPPEVVNDEGDGDASPNDEAGGDENNNGSDDAAVTPLPADGDGGLSPAQGEGGSVPVSIPATPTTTTNTPQVTTATRPGVRIDDSSAQAQLAEDDSTSAPQSPDGAATEEDASSTKKKGRSRAMTTKAEFNAVIAAAAFAAKNKDVSNSTLKAFSVAEQLVKAFQSDQDGELLDSIAGKHLARTTDEAFGERSWTPYRKSEAKEQALSKKLEDLLYNGHGLGARMAQKRQEELGGGDGAGDGGAGGFDGGMGMSTYLTVPVTNESGRASRDGGSSSPGRGGKAKKLNPHPLDEIFNSPDSPIFALTPNPSTGPRSGKHARRNLHQPDLDYFDKKKGANGMGQQQLLQVVAEASGRIPKSPRRDDSPNILLSKDFEGFGAAIAITESDGSSQYSDMDDGTSRASSRGGVGYTGGSPKKQLQLISPKKRRFPMIEDCKKMIKTLIPNHNHTSHGNGGFSPLESESGTGVSSGGGGGKHHPLFVMVSPSASRAHSTAVQRGGGGGGVRAASPSLSTPNNKAVVGLEKNWNAKGVSEDVAYTYHSRKPYSAADVAITTATGDVLIDGLDAGSPFSNTGLLNRHCCYGLKGGSRAETSGGGLYDLVPSISIDGFGGGGHEDTTTLDYTRPCKPVTCRMKATLQTPVLRSKVDYSTFCGKPLPGSDDMYDRQARATTPPINKHQSTGTPRRAQTPRAGTPLVSSPGYAIRDDYGRLGTPLSHHSHLQQGQLLRKLMPAEALEYMGMRGGSRGNSPSSSHQQASSIRRRELGIESSMTPTHAKVSTTEYFLTQPSSSGRSKPTINKPNNNNNNNNTTSDSPALSPAFARLGVGRSGVGRGGGGGGALSSSPNERDSRAIRAMLEADQRLRSAHRGGYHDDDLTSSCSSVGGILAPKRIGGGGAASSPHSHKHSNNKRHHSYNIPIATTPTVSEFYDRPRSVPRRAPSSGSTRHPSRSPAPAAPYGGGVDYHNPQSGGGSSPVPSMPHFQALSPNDSRQDSGMMAYDLSPPPPQSVAEALRMKYSKVLGGGRKKATTALSGEEEDHRYDQ